MEIGLIFAIFISNVIGLECLYNSRYKTTGALLILNLCLTVALAYQFQQMDKIIMILFVVVLIIAVFFGGRVYLNYRRHHPKAEIIEQIEEKESE